MSDVLARTLEALRLRGTVYFEADLHAPWGMAVPARDVAVFHVVAAGQGWLRMPGEEPRLLRAGSIALLPQGSPHALVHEADGDAAPAEELLQQLRTQSPMPPSSASSVTTLVCGHFSYQGDALHPFFRSLPPLVLVHCAEDEKSGWLATAARLAAAESESGRRGASAVVDRLAEALLLQTLRLYLDHTDLPRGFVAALEDPYIGRALAAVHEDPGAPWSHAALAREAGLSGSAFSDRFRDLVQETPMRYLTHWRMLTASSLLREGVLSTAQIASRVGYQSEFSFARAFKRHYGQGPGAVRRSA